MQAIIDQLIIWLGSDVLLRQLVIWLTAISVFVLFLGGALLASNYFDPVRRRVGDLADKPRKKNDWLEKVATASRFMSDMESGSVVLYAMIAAGVGMLAPNVVLEKLVDKRMRTISHAFPDALDLLVVCVESGLGLSSALQRVADELEVSHPELARELATVNSEIRVGVQREQALNIRGLVALLVQTMRFGTGVADALRVYSEEFRDKRMQKAEEQAAKMGTKIVFPLVLCMFPCFFIVAIGPAVIRNTFA